MHETVGAHTHHNCGGSGVLRKCAHSHTLMKVRTKVFTLEGTLPRCPVIPMVRSSRWSCLIWLQARIDIFAWVFQAIGREIAPPRHILYAYANRPHLPPSPPRSSARLSARTLVISPLLRVPSLSFIVTLKWVVNERFCCRLFDSCLMQWKLDISCHLSYVATIVEGYLKNYEP